MNYTIRYLSPPVSAYLDAQTEGELLEAYHAMLEWSDAPEGLERDEVDHMLDALGLPTLAARLRKVRA